MNIWKEWTMATLVGTFAGAPVAAVFSLGVFGGFFLCSYFPKPFHYSYNAVVLDATNPLGLFENLDTGLFCLLNC